jgi:hypothetical protein
MLVIDDQGVHWSVRGIRPAGANTPFMVPVANAPPLTRPANTPVEVLIDKTNRPVQVPRLYMGPAAQQAVWRALAAARRVRMVALRQQAGQLRGEVRNWRLLAAARQRRLVALRQQVQQLQAQVQANAQQGGLTVVQADRLDRTNRRVRNLSAATDAFVNACEY